MQKLKETKVYSISDFMEWNSSQGLVISPRYQRKSVWNEKAKSYLIDTIIRDLPIPQIMIRQSIDTRLGTTTREVIDGQQRLRAIIGFYTNEFPIMKIHNKDYGGMYYDDLTEDDKTSFLDYQLSVEVIKSSDDNVIYDMFMRVNTNSIVLNSQELRNAKYWGDLKVLAYNLSSEWRSFLLEYNVIKESQIIRMMDVEFISRLLRVIIDGVVTDTPKKLDDFYQDNQSMDNSFEVETQFNSVMNFIQCIFSDPKTYLLYFNKQNYMYTLFAYIYLNLDTTDCSAEVMNRFILSLSNLESDLEHKNKPDSEIFEELHKKRTTNENERQQRIDMLKQYMENGEF